MTAHINPDEIPGESLDPEAVTAAAGKMRTVGAKFSTQAGRVLTAWQKISGHYEAPESETLFAVMDPVTANAETFSTNLDTVACALETYADKAGTVKAALATLKIEAHEFISTTVAKGVECTVTSGAGRKLHVTPAVETTFAENVGSTRRSARCASPTDRCRFVPA